MGRIDNERCINGLLYLYFFVHFVPFVPVIMQQMYIVNERNDING